MEIAKARYKYQKRPPKKLRGNFIILIIVTVVFLFSSTGYAFAAFAKEFPALQVTMVPIAEKPAEQVALAWPAKGQAAIGSLEDGLLSASPDEKTMPIASMTKVITVLAILEKSPFELGQSGKSYTLSAADEKIYNQYIAKNGAVVPIKAGQTLTENQLLQAILLASANNLADTLAIRQFGSIEDYTVYANSMIKGYGLSKTVVSDASGFSPNTVSTPSELIVIGQKALQNPIIADIVKKPQTVIPGIGVIKNTNRLLKDSNIIGIKTGTTDEAGNCLLFAARHEIDEANAVIIIGVIMGDANAAKVYADASALLTSAAQGFGKIDVVPSGTVVGKVHSDWGQDVTITTDTSLQTYGWKGKTYEAEVVLDQSTIPLSSGDVLGKVIMSDTETIEVDAKSDGTITAPSNIWRLTNVF